MDPPQLVSSSNQGVTTNALILTSISSLLSSSKLQCNNMIHAMVTYVGWPSKLSGGKYTAHDLCCLPVSIEVVCYITMILWYKLVIQLYVKNGENSFQIKLPVLMHFQMKWYPMRNDKNSFKIWGSTRYQHVSLVSRWGRTLCLTGIARERGMYRSVVAFVSSMVVSGRGTSALVLRINANYETLFVWSY